MAKKTNKLKAKTTEEKSEEVKQPETEEPKEESVDSVPKFKNNGKAIKINLGTRDEPKWITVKEGAIVTIPEKLALANNLEKVE